MHEPSSGEDSAVLDVAHLYRAFGSRDVVRALSLRLDAGARVAFAGPNGSGKTTVLRCIAGTLSPTSGTITVAGHVAGTMQARELVGASLAQERSFYLRLTGHTNLLFFARLRFRTEKEARQGVERLEDELELDSIVGQRVETFSSGMIQQLALARALLGGPRLLLLDEPTKSLDAGAQGRLWAALDRRPETAVVIATHLDEDLRHCDRRLDFPQ